jgi:hypothetical protein
VRILLLAVVALLAAAGGLALALNHYFGWKGLLAYPVLLIGLVWLGKIVITKLVKRFFLGLFGMKAGVLRGASMIAHSIVPVPKPPQPQADPEDKPNDAAEADDADDDDGEPDDERADEEPAKPQVYYEIDITITPRRPDDDAVWEPTELMLTSQPINSLEDLADNEVGTTYDCLIWNGSAFVEDDIGKYPGEQRLKLTVEVTPGTRHTWLYYYQEKIGPLELPEWRLDAATPT